MGEVDDVLHGGGTWTGSEEWARPRGTQSQVCVESSVFSQYTLKKKGQPET